MNHLTIVSLNIANAVGDEKVEEYRFGMRLDKICNLIKEQNPDIVMLQEIRQCRDQDGNIINVYDIAHKISTQTGLSIAGLFTLNPSTLAFSRLTLYNNQTVFPFQCFGEWLSNTPNVPSGCSSETPKRFGVGAQFTQFGKIVDKENVLFQGEPFWTVNVHYPIPEADKMYTNKWLISRVTSLKEKAIIMGDFNTFFKIDVNGHVEDGNGELQVAELQKVFFDASQHISYTFTPFPHDSMVARLGTFIDTKLDHAFLFPNENFIQSCEVVSTKDNRESDHYMLKVVL